MDYEKKRVRTAYPVDIPFNDEESDTFRAYLKSTGRKAGPWIRVLILHAIEQEKALMSGMSQVDIGFINAKKQELAVRTAGNETQ